MATNFERLTASKEVLGSFLAELPVLSGPWDAEFQERFCGGCKSDCDGACPHEAERNNPTWWLGQNRKDVTT